MRRRTNDGYRRLVPEKLTGTSSDVKKQSRVAVDGRFSGREFSTIAFGVWRSTVS